MHFPKILCSLVETLFFAGASATLRRNPKCTINISTQFSLSQTTKSPNVLLIFTIKFSRLSTRKFRRKIIQASNNKILQFSRFDSLPLLCLFNVIFHPNTAKTSTKYQTSILSQKKNNIQRPNIPKSVPKCNLFSKNFLIQFIGFQYNHFLGSFI